MVEVADSRQPTADATVDVARADLVEVCRATRQQVAAVEQQITRLQLQRAHLLGRLQFAEQLLNPTPPAAEPNGAG